MAYEEISLPAFRPFREMTDSELEQFASWFLRVVPSRIIQLRELVRADEYSSSWDADGSVESFSTLGFWFAAHAESILRPPSEIARVQERTGNLNHVDARIPSPSTKSFSMDIGMYFGESLRQCHSPLGWHQALDLPRLSSNFGFMLIMKPGAERESRCNPIALGLSLAMGLIRREKDGSRLRILFNAWKKRLASTRPQWF